MTTTINFNPTTNSNFQFSATLDNNVYNVIVTWNLFGARYYVNIYDLSSNLIVSTPLIGTPLGYNIDALTSANNIAYATTETNFTYTVGSVIPLTISGISPTGYNGTYECTITGQNTFTYPLGEDLDPSIQTGQVVYNLSLVAGYFDSTMTYFPDSEQIIINP
jgi:hypothetical protein